MTAGAPRDDPALVRPTVLLGCVGSMLIEVGQLFVPGRTTSITDVLANSAVCVHCWGTLEVAALIAAWATVPVTRPSAAREPRRGQHDEGDGHS